MRLRPETLPPIPDVTAAAVRAAFPKGNLYVELRAEFGTLYTDQLFADLYPPEGRPVEGEQGDAGDYGSTPVQWPGSFTCHSNPEKRPYACQTSARLVQR